MARTFGTYSPIVPLGVTWQEPLVMADEAGDAVDLTGYAVRAQLRAAKPVGSPPPSPVIEFTTPDYYDVAPAWPVVEAFSLPDPAEGSMLLTVQPVDFAGVVSPTNERKKLYWEIVLVNQDTGEIVPVVEGKVVFKPAVTL